jgi:hypothetical protein
MRKVKHAFNILEGITLVGRDQLEDARVDGMTKSKLILKNQGVLVQTDQRGTVMYTVMNTPASSRLGIS